MGRRKAANGSQRPSSIATVKTNQTVSDSAGPTPKRAPGALAPTPPMSTTKAAACQAQPAHSQGMPCGFRPRHAAAA